MATDYGTDIACGDDLDPNFTLVSGRALVAQDILHRLSTARGSLEWAPDDGLDLTSKLSADIDEDDILALQQDIAAEAQKDERIVNAVATAIYDYATEKLTVTLGGELTDGPFSFVFTVDKLGVYLEGAP